MYACCIVKGRECKEENRKGKQENGKRKMATQSLALRFQVLVRGPTPRSEETQVPVACFELTGKSSNSLTTPPNERHVVIYARVEPSVIVRKAGPLTNNH